VFTAGFYHRRGIVGSISRLVHGRSLLAAKKTRSVNTRPGRQGCLATRLEPRSRRFKPPAV
jgi:hypothetical protein